MDLEELSRRVQAIEDLEAIKKLHQSYINFMDELKYEEAVKLFTDDAITQIRDHGVQQGKAKLKQVFDNIKLRARKNSRTDAHLAIEPDITVNGDIAEGRWLIYILFSEPTIQWVQGINECQYRKENGIWKISKLKFTRTTASDKSMYP